MPKITSSIFVSLDGFSADSNNDVSWFKPTDEFFKYSSLVIKNADTAIYGRKTFEMMDAYWPTADKLPDADWHEIEHSAWYNSSQKIVFSKTLKSTNDNVLILDVNSTEKLREIKENSSKDLVIFGSPSIVSLLTEANLIDEYYIFVVPIILGSGVPLFHGIETRRNLKLVESKILENGAVLLRYKK